MPFPKDIVELNEQGYRYHSTARCKCGVKMLFYHTPRGKLIPLNAETLVSHFGECPFSKEFQRKKKA